MPGADRMQGAAIRLLRNLLRARAPILPIFLLLGLGAITFATLAALPARGTPFVYFAGVLTALAFLVAALSARRRNVTFKALSAMRASSRPPARNLRLDSLQSPVNIEYDRFGVPTITARTREDALRTLGYVTANERLFQMDLLRREASGRVAEIMGEEALNRDVARRALGFNRLAEKISAALPPAQQAALTAYAEGVNACIDGMQALPFEFTTLDYKPEPWRPDDSILVSLVLFEMLSFDSESERMMTIMERSLPPEVVAFLTPDTDEYDTVLTGGAGSRRPIRPVPVELLAALRNARGKHPRDGNRIVSPVAPLGGSNAYVVDGSRTANGRAILANDVHLPLAVPNLLYRATLTYAEVTVSGVTVPGLPLVIAGSNNRVAWGVTNLYADCLDLVLLETNPVDDDEYRTPQGWERFAHISETITVRGGRSYTADVRTTRWGPVYTTNLAGSPAAVRWTALDPGALDLGLLDLDRVRTVEEAVAVVNHSHGPPLSFTFADNDGRIAWTVCGPLPLRRGFDGTAARSWASGEVGWDGYVPREELPRVIDPPEGFLVSANNRLVGADYPHILGHNFQNAYRAYRINQCLRERSPVDEVAMFEIQTDTVAEPLEFYRTLALDALRAEGQRDARRSRKPRRVLEAWDGRAEPDSCGLALLVHFRTLLAEAVLAPLLEPCRVLDPRFSYAWHNFESPLRQLLMDRHLATLPTPYADWNALVVAVLFEADAAVAKARGRRAGSIWAAWNRVKLHHPLSGVIRPLAPLVDMTATPLAGCAHCVCVADAAYGAAMRMVVAPGHHEDGFLHIPCGQSGHPVSAHYADQQPFWANRRPLPFAAR